MGTRRKIRREERAFPRARRQLRVFLSLPNRADLRSYAETLGTAISKRYGRFSVDHYLLLDQGDWRVELIHQIRLCNGLVALLHELNCNVVFELGQALAFGKPVILVAPHALRPPSMFDNLQIIYHKGKCPSQHTTHRLLQALAKIVFPGLHRGTSDERTDFQKHLLVGSRKATPHGLLPRSLKRSPRDHAALAGAADAYRSMDLSRAATILAHRANEGSRDEAIWHALADTWFLLGEDSPDPLRARECYQRQLRYSDAGLRKFHTSFWLRKDRALALAKLGSFDAAERQFSNLRGCGQDSLLDYNLACIAAQTGRRFEALVLRHTLILG